MDTLTVIVLLLLIIILSFLSYYRKKEYEAKKKLQKGVISILRSNSELAKRTWGYDVRRTPLWDDHIRLSIVTGLLLEQLASEIDDLTKTRAELSAVFSHMKDSVMLLNAKKRIVLVNQAAEVLFESTGEKLCGKHQLQVLANSHLTEKIDQVLEHMEPEHFSMQYQKNGKLNLDVQIIPVFEPDPRERKLSGILLVIRDITNSELLNQMKTDFVANVSHELHTPLTTIQGFSETLLEGAYKDEESALKFLTYIHEESKRMGRLVDDLLDLSLIEAGEMVLRAEPLNLKSIVNDVFVDFALLAEEKAIALKDSVEDDLPLVYADSDKIRQVLYNLIENAIKYSAEGGRVSVAAREKGAYLVVTVKDTGIGISQEQQRRIFERFYRVDKARSRASGGTGLGLSIVKHLIDIHDGEVGVISKPGKGSTFYFTLPLAEK